MNLSINEKISGAVFGLAIGDALGLGTEFMSRPVVKRRYPDGLTHYSQIVRDAHRSQWKKGQWTNDTEVALMLLESLCEFEAFNFGDYAVRLKQWYLSNPVDLTNNLRWVLSQPNFAEDPFSSTRQVWTRKKDVEATSECLGRAIFTGIWNENMIHHTLESCRITHPESRCETSCMIIATMANSLMWKDTPASYEELIKIARDSNPEVTRYVEMARHGSIVDFNLDDEETCWYVRKAMGAALWVIWHCDSFSSGLKAIIEQGGDADTNACVAGGLLGLKFGVDSIPSHLMEEIIGSDRLRGICSKLSALIAKKFA